MYAEERQQHIATAARIAGRVDVAELSAELEVTTETIRRDLSVLERHGILRRVHGGGRYVDPDLAMTALMTEECPLTERELEVLRHVDASGTAADIARRVHLSPGTVRNYLSSAMHKLGAGTRLEAVVGTPAVR